jgi:hypothetical protein
MESIVATIVVIILRTRGEDCAIQHDKQETIDQNTDSEGEIQAANRGNENESPCRPSFRRRSYMMHLPEESIIVRILNINNQMLRIAWTVLHIGAKDEHGLSCDEDWRRIGEGLAKVWQPERGFEVL